MFKGKVYAVINKYKIIFKTLGELIVIDFQFEIHIDIYNYCYHLGLIWVGVMFRWCHQTQRGNNVIKFYNKACYKTIWIDPKYKTLIIKLLRLKKQIYSNLRSF